MKKSNLTILLLCLIFIPSTVMYLIHWMIFKDAQYLLKDFLSQLAFLPVYYFVTTILIDTIMARREKDKIMKNINTLIGVFFSEFGNDFIHFCSGFDTNFVQYSKQFHITSSWDDSAYEKAINLVRGSNFHLQMRQQSLGEFKEFLLTRRGCMLTILENNNLVEHDTFTDLLLAIFHLCEEFKYRDIDSMTDNDMEHLAVDTIRAYSLIGIEWLKYSKYLKDEYPHLYSLSISYNPFL